MNWTGRKTGTTLTWIMITFTANFLLLAADLAGILKLFDPRPHLQFQQNPCPPSSFRTTFFGNQVFQYGHFPILGL